MPARPSPAAPRRRSAGKSAAFAIPADYGPQRGLVRQREARRLVAIGRNPEGRTIRLTPASAAAWRRMHRAAAADGIALIPISGFRSVRRQIQIIQRKLAEGIPLEVILQSVAAPGYSEHHTGRAIDIGSTEHIELDEDFARTRAFRWLRRHAATHGFSLSFPRGNRHGIVYEPWHWCWRRPQT